MADTKLTRVQIALEGTNQGAMERLFLLEAVTPGYKHIYKPDENLRAMRLMRQMIENRLRSPTEYNARGATNETDIVELGNQFAGFSNYPALNAKMKANLDDILQAANNARNPQRAAYVQFVTDAVTAATDVITPPTATFPNVTAWRTHGSGSPGPRFRTLIMLSGNTFFSTLPVPPHPGHRIRQHKH